MRGRRVGGVFAALVVALLMPSPVPVAAQHATNPTDDVLAALGDDLQTRTEWSTFYLHAMPGASPGRTVAGPVEHGPDDYGYPDLVPSTGVVDDSEPDFRYQLDLRRPTGEFRVEAGPVTGPGQPGPEDSVVVIGPRVTADAVGRGDHRVAEASVATFSMPPPLGARCPWASGFDPATDACTTITDFDATFYVSSPPGAAAAVTDIRVGVFVIDRDGDRIDHGGNCEPVLAAAAPCDAATPYATLVLHRQDAQVALPGGQGNLSDERVAAPVNVYHGHLKLGVPGESPAPLPLRSGERLGIDISTAAGAVHLDTAAFPSHIRTYSDSMRMAVWTENITGEATDVFPTAQSASHAERTITIRGVQHNVWGNADCGSTQNRSFACPLDNIDQAQMRLRIREMLPHQRDLYPGDPIILAPTGGPDGGPLLVATCCDTGQIQYQGVYGTVATYQYEFTYPRDFNDGTYEVEFFQPQSHDNPWVVDYRFRVVAPEP